MFHLERAAVVAAVAISLVTIVPALLALGYRIIDEEKMLKDELVGYREYTQKVHYRLVPGVW